MVRFQLGYGNSVQEVEVPGANYLTVMRPKTIRREGSEAEVVEKALLCPIASSRLSQLARPGEKVAIITSDITRPMPSYKVLPGVLKELRSAGVSLADVTVIFGLGCHRGQSEAEMRRLVGDAVYDSVRCEDSAPDDCVYLGRTARGTPVEISRNAASADRRVALGNIEYHYFAGYSGGAKALLPGAASRAAIQANHSHMIESAAAAGRLEGNPVREDIDEVLRFCPLDFILNVVLDERKEIVRAVAGHPIKAHRAGCEFLDELCASPMEKRADIVIASQGGAPKDMNLYQTQKALDNAKYAVREGGVIILVGACGEGLGERVFERWMLDSPSPESMIERIAGDFQLGGHKAAAIALTLRQAEVYLVSDMAPALVEKIFLRPFATAREALDEALRRLGPRAKVLVMPYAGATLPVIK
ncbi:MAG: nickel-dependent lactate racemase [Peptococcaceae bacterium]|jgi:nickel-dependent lactate racemase|nr:nickel-dependent lactate racemase [Peptococcaceae bacterium]